MELILKINISALIISILAGIFTVLLGKFRNWSRTERLHYFKREDYNPKVSIIIPVWNEKSVIENTIRNLQESYYKNFEIIVVDDNSDDGTFEVLQKLQKEFSNLKVLRKKGPRGKAQSINEGFEVASGEIILILDADSRISPEYLSVHVASFMNDEIGMLFTGFEPYNYKKSNLAHKVQEVFFSFVKDVIYSNIFLKMIFMGNGVFFRKKLLEKVLPLDPDTLVDDYNIATKISKMGVKEYFSIHPWVGVQYVNSLKELWNQHLRWYYGGFREIVKRIRMGDRIYLFGYTLAFVMFSLPIVFTVLLLTYGNFWFFLGFYLLTYVFSMFFFSQVFNPVRKVSIVDSLWLPWFIMIFEYTVFLPAMIRALYKKKSDWYKVKRDAM